jgi:hypothetical protein
MHLGYYWDFHLLGVTLGCLLAIELFKVGYMTDEMQVKVAYSKKSEIHIQSTTKDVPDIKPMTTQLVLEIVKHRLPFD